jgi:hypothetical protein
MTVTATNVAAMAQFAARRPNGTGTLFAALMTKIEAATIDITDLITATTTAGGVGIAGSCAFCGPLIARRDDACTSEATLRVSQLREWWWARDTAQTGMREWGPRIAENLPIA